MKTSYSRAGAAYRTCSLLLLFTLCFVGCEKDPVKQNFDEGLHKTESIGKTESNIKIIAAKDFLKSDVFDSFIYDKKSISKDTTTNKGQHLPKKHYHLLGEVRTLKQKEQTVYVAFIKEEGAKSNLNYFENLVVEKNKRGVAGYVFRYGLDSELQSIKRLPNYNSGSAFKQYSEKYSGPTGPDPCVVEGTKYIPCPCQGHIDPAICSCPTPPQVITTTHHIEMCEKPEDPIGPEGPSKPITFSDGSVPKGSSSNDNNNNNTPPVICLENGEEEMHYSDGTSTPQLCATIEAQSVPANPTSPVPVPELSEDGGYIVSTSPFVKYPKGSNYEIP